MDDVVNEFLIESYENLDRLDSEFVALEEDPEGATETLQSIFRTIHTIKGTCGFLGFGKLEKVTHVGENLLSKLRDGLLSVDQEITTALLSLVDAVRAMLAEIEETGAEGGEDYSDLIDLLGRLLEEDDDAHGERASQSTADSEPAESEEPTTSEEAPKTPTAGAPEPTTAATDQRSSKEAKAAPKQRSGSAADSTIRVEVGLLDKLMTLVGELVLARNQVMQFTGELEHQGILTTSQRLNLITSELQESVMKTRMQPISGVWNKLPRVIRDLSVVCGKKVRLEMKGKETELDKTLLEAIKDPLTHIVRNSVDHGIEHPGVRAERGKDETGLLRLSAYHEGGQVVIEIFDDGGGIDPQKVVAKALERGLVTPDQAARMTERDMVSLIMCPGFSTAEQVTNVSGRGVGMDVVRTNIEKIGGSIEVLSTPGEGTSMRIKIPLTLAIVPALLVTSGDRRYAIPQASLQELVRLDADLARSQIEHLKGAPVYRLRGRILPLIYLSEALGLEREPEHEPEAEDPHATNIVVLQADGRRFGLVVDRVNDTEEIVVKPLSKHLSTIPVYSGATIMGDGTVALIIDVVGVAKSLGLVGQDSEASEWEDDDESNGMQSTAEGHLIVSPDGRSRLAIPLSTVSRLEELEAESLEVMGEHQVVQYRGAIMPVVFVQQLIGFAGSFEEPKEGLLQVVVFTHRGVTVGLEVGSIVDIVAERIEIRSDSSRFGVEGSAVLQGRVTELLAVENVLESILSSFQPAAAIA